MKILVLSDDFPPEVGGGAGMIAFRLAKEFIRQGHSVQVLSTTQNKSKKNLGDYRVEFEGVPVKFFYSSYNDRWRAYVSLWNPRAMAEVRKIINEFKPDLVHAHNIHGHISYKALSLAKRLVPKVFLTAHDIMAFYPGTFTEFINPKDLSCPESFDFRVMPLMLIKKFRYRYNPFRNLIIRNCLRKINRVVAVSDSLKDALTQNKITNISVIKNGIDVSAWQKVSQGDTDLFRQSFGLGKEPVIWFGGRLSGAKGGDIIIQALELVVKKIPEAKLLVVGKKEGYGERMARKATSLGLQNNLVFTGWLSENDVKKSYAASVVVVVPSVCFDSFPNHNLEAFASGKPVVSTCFGGSKEIVQNGKNGYIVNPFNVTDLSQKISDLILDQEKNKQFGLAGLELVKNKFQIDQMAADYLSLFAH